MNVKELRERLNELWLQGRITATTEVRIDIDFAEHEIEGVDVGNNSVNIIVGERIE